MNFIELKHKFNITSIDEAFECLFSLKLNRHERLRILRELRWSYRYMRNCMFRIMKEAKNIELLKRILDHESVPQELLDKRDPFVFKRLTRYEFIDQFPYFEARRALRDDYKLDGLYYFIKLFHHVNHPTMYYWGPLSNYLSRKDHPDSSLFCDQIQRIACHGLCSNNIYEKALDDCDIDCIYRYPLDYVKKVSKEKIIKLIEESIKLTIVNRYNYIREHVHEEYTDEFDLFLKQYHIEDPSQKDRVSVMRGKLDEIMELTKNPEREIPSLFKVFSRRIGLVRILNTNEYNTSNYLPLTLSNETSASARMECYLEEEPDDSDDDEESDYDFTDLGNEYCLCPNDPNKKLVWGMSCLMGKELFKPYFIKEFPDMKSSYDDEFPWVEVIGETNYLFPFFYGDEHLFKLFDNDEEQIKKYLYEEMYRRIHDKLKMN